MNNSRDIQNEHSYRSVLATKLQKGLLMTETLTNDVTRALTSPDYSRIRKAQDKLQHLYSVVKAMYNNMTQLNASYENTTDSKVDLLILDRSTPKRMRYFLEIEELIGNCISKQKRFGSFAEDKERSKKLINILRNEDGIVKSLMSYFQWFLDALRVYRGEANSSYSDETAREDFINQFNRKAKDYKQSSKYLENQQSYLTDILSSSPFRTFTVEREEIEHENTLIQLISEHLKRCTKKTISSVPTLFAGYSSCGKSIFDKIIAKSIIASLDLSRKVDSSAELNGFVETLVDYEGFDEQRRTFTPKVFNGLPLRVVNHRDRGRPPSAVLDDYYDGGRIGLLLLKLNSEVNEVPSSRGVALSASYDVAAKFVAFTDFVKNTLKKNVGHCISELYRCFPKAKSICGVRWLQRIILWYDEIRNDDVGVPDRHSHEGIVYRLFSKRIEHYKEVLAA